MSNVFRLVVKCVELCRASGSLDARDRPGHAGGGHSALHHCSAGKHRNCTVRKSSSIPTYFSHFLPLSLPPTPFLCLSEWPSLLPSLSPSTHHPSFLPSVGPCSFPSYIPSSLHLRSLQHLTPHALVRDEGSIAFLRCCPSLSKSLSSPPSWQGSVAAPSQLSPSALSACKPIPKCSLDPSHCLLTTLMRFWCAHCIHDLLTRCARP